MNTRNFRLAHALNWEDKKQAVRNKEALNENKIRRAYNTLRGTVKAKNVFNAFRKNNLNHFTLKQLVKSRKLNDLPTRISILESRVNSLEKILKGVSF